MPGIFRALSFFQRLVEPMGDPVPAARSIVLGVPVDRLTLDEAVARIRRFVAEGPGHLVVTPNPEMIFAAQTDGDLMSILRRADLAVADGAGVVWASRLLGTPVPERVTGVDLVEALLALGRGAGFRFFFLGTKETVMEQAVAQVRSQFPGVQVVGSHHGYFGPADEGRVTALIRRSRPDILFVGMGAQRELPWLVSHLDDLQVPVAMGVGGSFDVLAGAVLRAPLWMRSLNVEWLFRLYQEPARFRRMLVLPLFALMVLRASRFRKGELAK